MALGTIERAARFRCGDAESSVCRQPQKVIGVVRRSYDRVRAKTGSDVSINDLAPLGSHRRLCLSAPNIPTTAGFARLADSIPPVAIKSSLNSRSSSHYQSPWSGSVRAW